MLTPTATPLMAQQPQTQPVCRYTQAAFDPDRTAGSVAKYDSFSDFMATCEQDDADPSRVGLGDILDVINPLQHLPLVGSLYRFITGDTIKPAAMVAGGTIYGGGIGLVTSSVMAASRNDQGQDIGQRILSSLSPTEHYDQTV